MKLLTISALILAVATPAAAGSTAGVRLGSLDLTNPADAAVIAQRIDRAAADVCGASRFSARQVQVAIRRSDCYRETLDRALASLNAPAVSAALKTAPAAD